MKAKHKYTVKYRLNRSDETQRIIVYAGNKAEAYAEATFKAIPMMHEGCYPFSAWVENVIYKNGDVRTFNTFEGEPY